MNHIVKENLWKNVILIVLLILSFMATQQYLLNSDLNLDVTASGNILIAIGIIMVTACFGNFAFTYDKLDQKNTFQRYLSHTVTAGFMFIMGVSIIFTKFLIDAIMGNFFLVDISLVVLYFACVAFDFWDVFAINLEAQKKKK